MSPRFSFRPAVEADFEPLLVIRVNVMREHLERVFRYEPARARRIFRGHFDEGGMRAIEVAGVLAGCVRFARADDCYRLDSLYLARIHHNTGPGAAVVAPLLAEADAARLPVRLEVLRGSKADRFWERHGFVALGADAIETRYERPTP